MDVVILNAVQTAARTRIVVVSPISETSQAPLFVTNIHATVVMYKPTTKQGNLDLPIAWTLYAPYSHLTWNALQVMFLAIRDKGGTQYLLSFAIKKEIFIFSDVVSLPVRLVVLIGIWHHDTIVGESDHGQWCPLGQFIQPNLPTSLGRQGVIQKFELYLGCAMLWFKILYSSLL